MIEWIASLTLELKVFYGIAVASLLVVVIQMLMTLLGLGFEAVDLDLPELDFDADSPSADSELSSSGLGFFSSQTIGAFFLGFGWTGVVLLNRDWPMALTIFAAFSVGGTVMTGMYFLLAGMLSLQGKGNLVYSSAIGQVGEVYVTIPGAGANGHGQIQVLVQNRLTTADARQTSPALLPPGAKVRIVGMESPTTFRVEPVAPPS